MKLLRNKVFRQTLAAIVIAVVAYFFYTSLQKNWASVREIQFTFNWYVVAAIALFSIAVVTSGWLWGLMLNIQIRSSGKRISLADAVRVHTASWLLKYIPGQAGSLVNKVVWANTQGISKKIAVISFLYENIFLLIASFITGIPLLFVTRESDVVTHNLLYVIAVILILVVGLVSTRTKITHLVLGRLLRRLSGQAVTPDLFLSYWQVVKIQVLYLLPRLLNGVGAVFVALSFVSIPQEAYVPVAASYVVAAAIGMLALFVPSGIGVRESFFVLLLGNVIPTEQAILIAIVARFYSTIADIVLAGLYVIIRSNRKLPT